MIEEINVCMRSSHAEEEQQRVTAWEIKDQNGKQHVQQKVTIPTHVEFPSLEPPFSITSNPLWVRPDNAHTPLIRENASDERLKQERNEEGGREAVSSKVLCQHALHGICFKKLCESHFTVPTQLLTLDTSETQPIQHQGRHEEGGGHVEADVEHASNHIKDEVARLSLVPGLETNVVTDSGAHFVHDGIAQNNHHTESHAKHESGLIAVIVIESSYLPSIR